jgi:hypothetical protein
MTSKDKIKEVINDKLWATFEKESNSNDGWYLEYQDEIATFYSKTLFPNCDLYTYKVVSTLNHPLQIFKEMYHDHDTRTIYNPDIKKCKQIFKE